MNDDAQKWLDLASDLMRVRNRLTSQFEVYSRDGDIQAVLGERLITLSNEVQTMALLAYSMSQPSLNESSKTIAERFNTVAQRVAPDCEIVDHHHLVRVFKELITQGAIIVGGE